MRREDKEAKKAKLQAKIVAMFPGVCKSKVWMRGLRGQSLKYCETMYDDLISDACTEFRLSFHHWEDIPDIPKQYLKGLDNELKNAWDVEVEKEKQSIISSVRERFASVCRIMVNSGCKRLLSVALTESEFKRAISLASSSQSKFQKSWSEELRDDVTTAWNAEVCKAKADGRIPATLEAAFHKAWDRMQIEKPFENHVRITWLCLESHLKGLVMGYPDDVWNSWPNNNGSLSDLEDFIPDEVAVGIKALYTEILSRGAKSAM